jgi:hypothetical protein
MNSFLKSLIETLVVVNSIAWMFPILEEIKISRLISVDGEVIESRVIADSAVTVQGAVIKIDQVSVRVKYKFNQHGYEQKIETAWLNGDKRPSNEINNYYYKGRKIIIWIDPVQPNEARLHKGNTYFVLPGMFLFILLVVLGFYIGAKND